jgi:hypothetical protein
MKCFGECFSKTISQRLDHDSTVIVMLLFIFLCQFVYTKAGAHSKHANIISNAAFLRCDKVRDAKIRFIRFFFLINSFNVLVSE